MNNAGDVIYCPNCTYSHLDTRINQMIVKHDILGSVTADYQISIRTKRGFLTIQTEFVILKHHCGYSYELYMNPGYKHKDIYEQK